MHTTEAIKSRRSIKHFDPQHKLSQQETTELLSMAALSPTAFNIQNWRFLRVTDSQVRKDIQAAAWDQAQITEASLLIVLCADLKSWEKEPQRYWKQAPEEVQKLMLPAIDNYYRNKNQVQRDEAMRSCGMAAQTLMLTAKAMGYDSCPMDGFDFDKVGQIINLPDDHIISMFVVIGKAIKKPWPRPGQLDLQDIVIENKFNNANCIE